MAKGQNTVAAVCKIVEPIAQSAGLEIWDVCFLKQGNDWYLQIYIDKSGGVSIDDCVQFTRLINDPLDRADPIAQAYCLEVSSPGVERELRRPEHFERCIGKKVKLKTIRPIDEKRDFCGTLLGCDGSTVSIDVGGETLKIEKKQAAWIKLDDFEF